EGLKPRPSIEVVDREITGKVVINANIFASAREFEDGIKQLKLPVIDLDGPDARESAYVLNFARASSRPICLNRTHLRGINFQVYDPRRLYPAEDCISFLFLQNTQAPFLDGRICDAFHSTQCPGPIDFAALPAADWYIRSPEIHLAGYF